MDLHPRHCPACGRKFTGVMDYPFVRILAMERLPVPEAVDSLSAPAAQKRLERRRHQPPDPTAWPEDGINMTPVIARAVDAPEVVEYLARLSALVGQEVNPQQLLPPLKASGYFPGAYLVADTGIYLSLSDPEPPAERGTVAEVQVHCDGPNLGSAGGATLQLLGAVARWRYQGLLTKAFRADS